LRENKIYIEAGAESPSGLEVMILKRGQGSEGKEESGTKKKKRFSKNVLKFVKN